MQQRNARKHQANHQAARLGKLLQEKGHTLQQIASELKEAGDRTRRGKRLLPMSVQRLLRRDLVVPTA